MLFFKDRTPQAARDEKGEIRKDQEGKTIYQDAGSGKRPICRQYTVFNVEQAEGLKLEPRGEELRPEWEAHREAEKVIKGQRSRDRTRSRRATGLTTGSRRTKLCSLSRVNSPTRNGYYQTALHEAGHATGHSSRMDRDSAQRRHRERALDRRSTPARNCGRRSAP